jgi:hypothetical protein
MLKKQAVIWGLMVCALVLSACAPKPLTKEELEAKAKAEAAAEQARQEEPGNLLLLVDREAGAHQSYNTRLFANKSYMHISDDRSPMDYILFDRRKQTIYNVTTEDKTIFVIRPKPVTIESPIEINYEEESQPSSAIPKIEGRQASHYRITINGEHCYDTVVLPEDFMPEVLGAMREFRQVLAGEHATTVNTMPKDVLDACDLAINIFEPTRHMSHGLPIREWDRNGYQRFLKDYRVNVAAPEGMLTLPKEFKRYSVGDVLVGNTGEGEKAE